jgi:hypothetical protein
MRTVAAFAWLSLFASPGFARDGANHHLGDDSFVAAFGRAPGMRDSERVRMKIHLEYVRELLGERAATKPELAARRAELLGYLDEYIAKGTTPRNTRVDHRSPVFIDDLGNICAVGYLIERSAGRALAEKIAQQYRHGFLEDIAAGMPEVSAWVEHSGLTLEELASIQPGYDPPRSVEEQWLRWDLAGLHKPVEGKHRDVYAADDKGQVATTGEFRGAKMQGTWTRAIGERVVGRGELRDGNGAWTSFYESGKPLASGPFVANHPHGEWKLFHESGNVAAIGRFEKGQRVGAWTFYYDTPKRTAVAKGSFQYGYARGEWRHYNAAGKLAMIVTARDADHLVAADLPGLRYEASITDNERVEGLIASDLRLFVYHSYSDPLIYDGDGHLLVQTAEGWTASDCRWSDKRKQMAAAGDVRTLGRVIGDDAKSGSGECSPSKPLPAKRAKRVAELFALAGTTTAKAPAFVDRFERPANNGSRDTHTLADDDLRDVLIDDLGVFAEWRHIDGRFIELYGTVAGYARWDHYDQTTRVLDEQLEGEQYEALEAQDERQAAEVAEQIAKQEVE